MAEDMAFCYRSKSTQVHVLYSIEDCPLRRRVRGTRRTGPGLRTWLSVTGAKVLKYMYSIEDSPLERRVRGMRRTGPELRTWLPVTGAKLLLEYRG
jgi:hypothetical protein